jgi:1-acyl-sn-glycerol-3-phosphate acyltransferase
LIFTVVWGFLATLSGLMGLSKMVHWFASSWGRVLFHATGCSLQIENPEKLYKKGPVIVVCNHQSLFDIITLYVILKDIQFRWMAKAALFKLPFLGWAMHQSGYIPVERSNKKLAMQSMFMAAKRIQGGTSVLIFPESTRTTLPEGKMLPFKKGAFIMAKKAKVVIQPITLWGAQRVVPKRFDVKIQRIRPGILKAIVHDPLMPEEYADLKTGDLSDKLKEIIESPMERLRVELPM